jgi:hypothetical protein
VRRLANGNDGSHPLIIDRGESVILLRASHR